MKNRFAKVGLEKKTGKFREIRAEAIIYVIENAWPDTDKSFSIFLQEVKQRETTRKYVFFCR